MIPLGLPGGFIFGTVVFDGYAYLMATKKIP